MLAGSIIEDERDIFETIDEVPTIRACIAVAVAVRRARVRVCSFVGIGPFILMTYLSTRTKETYILRT